MRSRDGGLAWVKLYPSDLLGSTFVMELTLAEFGLYMKLLAYQAADTNGSLPGDPERIRRALGVDRDEWASCWPVLEDRFPELGGGRRANPRMREEWEELMRQCEKRRRAASKAASKRWGSDAQSSPECESHSVTHSESHGSQSQSQSQSIEPESEPRDTETRGRAQGARAPSPAAPDSPALPPRGDALNRKQAWGVVLKQAPSLTQLAELWDEWWTEARAAGRPPKATKATWLRRGLTLADLGPEKARFLLEAGRDSGWRWPQWKFVADDWAESRRGTNTHNPELSREERLRLL